MDIQSLSPELRAKAIECKSPEELLALAKEEGVELSDDQIDAISGGSEWYCTGDGCNNFSNW